jgi:hypothetical protein
VHAVKAYRGWVEIWLHLFLSSALDWRRGQLHVLAASSPTKSFRCLLSRRVGGYRGGLYTMGVRTISCPLSTTLPGKGQRLGLFQRIMVIVYFSKRGSCLHISCLFVIIILLCFEIWVRFRVQEERWKEPNVPDPLEISYCVWTFSDGPHIFMYT